MAKELFNENSFSRLAEGGFILITGIIFNISIAMKLLNFLFTSLPNCNFKKMKYKYYNVHGTRSNKSNHTVHVRANSVCGYFLCGDHSREITTAQGNHNGCGEV
jgi:hypothetical protein